MRAQSGFSLLELVVSVALTLTVLAAVFSAIDPAHGAFVLEPESSDMQQRLRVAARTLAADLICAGARSSIVASSGPTAAGFPAVLPYRAGPLDPDPPAAARNDVITVVGVPPTAAETTTAQAIRAPTAATTLVSNAGCPLLAGARDPACGLRAGATVLIRDASGSDLFAVTAVTGGTVSLRQVRGALTRAFEAGSRIVEVMLTTYYLRGDDRARTSQLMRYNGASSDAPVVDHVVGLGFEYFGDPPGGVPGTPGTIAAADVARNPYPTVRRVCVRIRVQAAEDTLRGPAGALFAHGGSARRAARWLPDLETTVDVALRNAGLEQ
jgi:hypothetical protein